MKESPKNFWNVFILLGVVEGIILTLVLIFFLMK
jgi:hypothetical protein